MGSPGKVDDEEHKFDKETAPSNGPRQGLTIQTRTHNSANVPR
jgi:hypothetical protein